MKDALGLYLSQIGKIPLLTAAEEIQLSRQVQAGIALEQDVPPSKRTAAQNRVIRIGQKARRRMIEGNLRMVVAVAKKYSYFALSMADLIQEGSLGLNRAVEKFDHTRGYKFSTYAYWWIRQAMTRAIDQQARSIRVPIHVNELIIKLKKVSREFEQTNFRCPSVPELAVLLDKPENKIREAIEASQPIRSLNTKPPTSEGRVTEQQLLDMIADESQPLRRETFDEGLDESNFDEKMLLCLNPRELKVITQYFGLNNEKPVCLAEIGKTLLNETSTTPDSQARGVSRERTRQIRDTALRKLRFKAGVQRQCQISVPAEMVVEKAKAIA